MTTAPVVPVSVSEGIGWETAVTEEEKNSPIIPLSILSCVCADRRRHACRRGSQQQVHLAIRDKCPLSFPISSLCVCVCARNLEYAGSGELNKNHVCATQTNPLQALVVVS